MASKQTYLQSLGTLQLLAIVMVVVGHCGVKDNNFMNSLGVSFCFIYSGFFTALHHPFDNTYGMGDHLRFMHNKLAKLYPLHVLAIVLNLAIIEIFQLANAIGLKVLLAHLTLLSSWIPYAAYYFGCNPVAWYICTLFFLYLMAPIVVRILRRMPVLWQVVTIALLLVLEFMGGYVRDMSTDDPLITGYYLYQFPPARLLDFAAGVIIYNLTCCDWWKRCAQRMTIKTSTMLEVGAIAAFALFYWLCSRYLHPHCFRAFCSSAPATLVLLVAFIFTSSQPGYISRALCHNFFSKLCSVGAEVYLLQFFAFFSLMPLFKLLHINDNPVIYVPIIVVALFLFSLMIHRYYTTPLYMKLRPGKRS